MGRESTITQKIRKIMIIQDSKYSTMTQRTIISDRFQASRIQDTSLTHNPAITECSEIR